MLQILADAGPMAIPLWAVLLWSVSMYPLGFLFGTCSGCCDGCEPCNKCNRAYDNPNGVDCLEITGLTITAGDYNAAYCFGGSIGPSATAPNACNVECYIEKFGTGWLGPFVPDLTSGPGPCSGFAPPQDIPPGLFGVFYFENAYVLYEFDECGCEKPYFFIETSNFTRNIGFQNEVRFGFEVKQLINDCATTSFSTTVDPESWQYIGESFPMLEVCLDDPYNEYIQPMIDYLKAIPITIAFSISPCECGACCDNGCEKNVASGGCTDWQGVGVDCDPDPCPQPGACCVNKECYQATEEQCGIDGGAWQAGACEPNPC